MADKQVAYDFARSQIQELNQPPNEQMNSIGLDDLMKTLNTPHSVFQLLPPKVGYLETPQGNFARYSEQNPPPEDIDLVTWNLRQADAQLEASARKAKVSYSSVFARK